MSQFHTLTVSKVQQLTRDSIAVTLAVPPALQAAFSYRQGQHLTLRALIDGEDVRRSYSICSAVQDNTLRVAIKRTAGGVFSGWANDTLQPGATLDVMPPSGQFNVALDAAHRRHYLAVAAGSGITPILSIIKTTLATEPHSRFTLLYGNRASSSVIFRDELADLKDSYLDRLSIAYIMSREQQDIALFNGRLSGDKCTELLRHWVRADDIDVAFVCGPEDMTQGVLAALQQAGMPREAIKTELFFACSAGSASPRLRSGATALPACAASTDVTVIMDGSAASFSMRRDDESLLDAGLRAGIDLRYACKGGVCSTCRCKLVEGQVDMDANYALEDYEIARGFILTCQSFPITDKVVIDFDQAE
ncbi:MAG: 1,2-phenylacetyl-CoA epoxidase subunit PaaE [Duganella sp.]